MKTHAHPLAAALALGLLSLLPAAAADSSTLAPAPAASVAEVAQAPDATTQTASAESTPAVTAESATPDDPHARESRSLLTLGANLTERGDFAAAEIAYRRVMNDRTYPAADQCDALLGIARMYRKQGSFTKAVAAYEKFLKLHPDDHRVPDALLELGRSQRAMGAYKHAINRFYNVINSTLKLPPESYEHYQLLARTAQFEIAETHYETGNFIEAAKFYDRLRLLDLAPEDHARAHFKSAGALLKAGEYESVVLRLHQFLELWPNDVHAPEARYQLALSLRQLGRTEEALTITLALLRDEQGNAERDPKTWSYWQRRTGNQLANEFFQNGDTLSAVVIYESLARLAPEPGWRLPIIYQTGLCYERLRQSDRAIGAYKDVVDALAAADEKTRTPELTELARMAQWRIGQIEWSERTQRQLDNFFSAATPRPQPSSAAPAAPDHDSDGSPATAPGTL